MQYIFVGSTRNNAIALTIPLPLEIPLYDHILLLWGGSHFNLRETGTIRIYADAVQYILHDRRAETF